MGDTNSLGQPRTWFSPWNYPSRVSNELSVRIAEAVALGADLKAACMREGVAWSRAMQWLRWGEDAYRRDADGNDVRAEYLNFFLKVMQAIGEAAVPLQQQSRLESPPWWLTHNPEQRGAWGAANAISATGLPGTDEAIVESEAASPTPLPRPTPESARTILRTLIKSGAAISPEEDGQEVG